MTFYCSQDDLNKDLSEKLIVVTGASTGIGLETCKQLYKQGAQLIMASRNMPRLEKGFAAVEASIQPGWCGHREVMTRVLTKPVLVELDLEDFDSVKKAAQEIKDICRLKIGESSSGKREVGKKIDVLLNNAAIMNQPKRHDSKQGLEQQIAINHFGHFLLTELLLENIADGGRIVVTSSAYSHSDHNNNFAAVDFDDLHFHARQYDGWVAYGQSKLANVMHAIDLSKRPELRARNITTVSLHPGFVNTELMRYTAPLPIQIIFKFVSRFFKGMIDVWAGSQTTIHCCVSDTTPKNNGAFYSAAFSPSHQYVGRDDLKPGGWPMKHPGWDSGTITDQKVETMKRVSMITCEKWLDNPK